MINLLQTKLPLKVTARGIRIRCIAHVLNIGVKAFLSNFFEGKMLWFICLKIAKKLRGTFYQNYKKICDELQFKDSRFPLPVETRWNSVNTLLSYFVKHKQAINECISDISFFKEEEIILNNERWNEISILNTFLNKFEVATMILSGSSYPTIHYAVPVYNYLFDHIENTKKETKDKIMKESLDILKSNLSK